MYEDNCIFKIKLLDQISNCNDYYRNTIFKYELICLNDGLFFFILITEDRNVIIFFNY